MQLKVKVIKGQEETLEVESDLVTVYDVKKIVESKTAIPIKLQSLVYKGKPLADTYTLSHYSIKDGDKLFVAVKAQCESDRAHDGQDARSKTTEDTAEQGKRDASVRHCSSDTPVAGDVTVLRESGLKCSASMNLPTSIPPHQPGGCWKPKSRFWEMLNALLQRHFAPNDVDRIIKIVCEDVREAVYDINLDAVEFLASEHLKAAQAQRDPRGSH